MKKLLLTSSLFLQITFVISQTCGGPALLDEKFDTGIPASFTILDLDGQTLTSTAIVKGFTGQWQPWTHLSRKCVANTCFFSSGGSADDYLITPSISLGTGPICLSWKASSQHSAYPESYQVRISNTTPTAAGFQALPALAMLSNEPAVWAEHSLDLSAYAGQTVYIAFWYNNSMSSNGFAMFLDDIRISKPVSRDALVDSLNINDVVAPVQQTISGKLFNAGTTTITSMQLNWQANSGPVNSMPLSSLNILSSSYYNFTHSAFWNPGGNGTFTVKVWASSINGSNDQYTGNDTLAQLVFVNTYQRKILFEDFTQASCVPCAVINPHIDSVLGPNQLNNKISVIRYHMAWPGVDPMNAFNMSDPEAMREYYGIVFIPVIAMDGKLLEEDCSLSPGYPGCLDQGDIDNEYAIPSIYDIQITKTITGNVLNTSVTVTAKNDIPWNSMMLRVGVIEDTIVYATAPGSNGETIFYQVLRKLLPDSNGINLPPMLNNQSLVYNYSYTFNPSVCVSSQLKVVAFVQSDSTRKVYQSGFSDPVSVGVAESSFVNNGISIYPNPTNGLFELRVANCQNCGLKIYNTLGQIVYQSAIHNLKSEIDLREVFSGIYFVQVRTEQGNAVKKLVINK